MNWNLQVYIFEVNREPDVPFPDLSDKPVQGQQVDHRMTPNCCLLHKKKDGCRTLDSDGLTAPRRLLPASCSLRSEVPES